jgi:Endonuclease/Exonuclease/phosphatase family
VGRARQTERSLVGSCPGNKIIGPGAKVANAPVACWSGIDFSLGEMLLRVADYNIKFLSVEDLDAKPQRKQRLKTVIEQLKPDILALQEIKDRQALEQLFDSDEWSILIDDDSNDAQDLAIVVRRPLKFKDRTDLDADDADFLFPGPTFENLFRNRRDVLVGVVEIPGETEPLHVHEKSRLGGRAVTDSIREGAARALVQKLDRTTKTNDSSCWGILMTIQTTSRSTYLRLEASTRKAEPKRMMEPS